MKGVKFHVDTNTCKVQSVFYTTSVRDIESEVLHEALHVSGSYTRHIYSFLYNIFHENFTNNEFCLGSLFLNFHPCMVPEVMSKGGDFLPYEWKKWVDRLHPS